MPKRRKGRRKGKKARAKKVRKAKKVRARRITRGYTTDTFTVHACRSRSSGRFSKAVQCRR